MARTKGVPTCFILSFNQTS